MVSMAFLGFEPTWGFTIGATFVTYSTYLYSAYPIKLELSQGSQQSGGPSGAMDKAESGGSGTAGSVSSRGGANTEESQPFLSPDKKWTSHRLLFCDTIIISGPVCWMNEIDTDKTAGLSAGNIYVHELK